MLRTVLCVSALALAVPAQAAFISAWDFNDSNLAPDHGNGVLTHTFSSVGFGSGSTVNARPGVGAGNGLNLQSNSNNGRHLVVRVSTLNFEDVVLSLAWRRNNNGFNSNHFAWSLDGTNFTAVSNNNNPPTSGYGVRTIDLSSIAALENKADVYLRITLNGAGNNGGNNMLDNLHVEASPMVVPAPGVSALALLGLAAVARRRR